MKASELRIGNYVLDRFGKRFQIKELHYKKIVRRHPIPLTEEWLVKFGFTKDDILADYVKQYKFGLSKRVLALSDIQSGFIIGSYDLPNFQGQTMTKIKYVNQLQNLFHSLTGEELCLKG